MYLSFEPKKKSLRQSADSQSTKYSVSELMVDPVQEEYSAHLMLSYHAHCVEMQRIDHINAVLQEPFLRKFILHFLFLSENAV